MADPSVSIETASPLITTVASSLLSSFFSAAPADSSPDVMPSPSTHVSSEVNSLLESDLDGLSSSPFANEKWRNDFKIAVATSKEALQMWYNVFWELFAWFVKTYPRVSILIVACIFMWRLRRHRYVRAVFDFFDRVKRVYSDTLKTIQRTSRFIPHLAYWIAVVGFQYFLSASPNPSSPDASASSSSSSPSGSDNNEANAGEKGNLGAPTIGAHILLFPIGVLFPLVLSFFASKGRSLPVCRQWLDYWCAFGLCFLLVQIPGLVRILKALPIFFDEFQVYFLIWLLLPSIDACSIFLGTFSPLTFRMHNALEGHGISAPSTEQRNMILRFLLAMGIIKPRFLDLVTRVFQGGAVILLAFAFFFTPAFLTYYGCLLTGILYPIYICSNRHHHLDINVCLRWLEYAVVYVASFMIFRFFDALAISGFPFWFDIQLVFGLWLQLPYFNGAQAIITGEIINLILGTSENEQDDGVDGGSGVGDGASRRIVREEEEEPHHLHSD